MARKLTKDKPATGDERTFVAVHQFGRFERYGWLVDDSRVVSTVDIELRPGMDPHPISVMPWEITWVIPRERERILREERARLRAQGGESDAGARSSEQRRPVAKRGSTRRLRR